MFVVSSSGSLSPLTSTRPRRLFSRPARAALLLGSLVPPRSHPLQSGSVWSLFPSVLSPFSARSAPGLLRRTQVDPTSPLWPDMPVAGNVHATTMNRIAHFLAREAGQHCLLSQTLGAGGLVASGLRRPHAISAIACLPLSLKTMMRVTATRIPFLSRAPVTLAEAQELLTSTIAAWMCHGPREVNMVERVERAR